MGMQINAGKRYRFTRKSPDASDDYQLVHDIVMTLEVANSADIKPENIPNSRKYLYELGSRHSKLFVSKKYGDTLVVMRLK